MSGTALKISPGSFKERRAKLRFPVVAELEYILQPSVSPSKTGRGVILNLSATGVLFKADSELSVGKPIQVSIRWPVSLEKVALKLVVEGRTVRAKDTLIAVEFSSYEFRTRITKR